MNILSKGTITDHSPGIVPKSQVDLGEDETLVFRYVEPYGIASFPADGSEAIVMSPYGSHDLSFVGMAVDMTRKRPALEKGESALYFSDKTFFSPRKDGTAEIQCEKGIRIKKGNQELLTLLAKILEAIDTQSFVGQNKVTNPQLKLLIEQLKLFIS